MRAQRYNGITYELAGTMIGDVAAAVGFDDFDALGGETGDVPNEVLLGAGAEPDGKNRIVFREHQRVADLTREALGDKRFLREPGGFIARSTPVDDRDFRRGSRRNDIWGGRGHWFIVRGIFRPAQLRALH